MISSPGCLCLGQRTPGSNSPRSWMASCPGMLRSWRCSSTRRVPGVAASADAHKSEAWIASAPKINAVFMVFLLSWFLVCGLGRGHCLVRGRATWRSTQRLERCAHLRDEELRLFPCREMSALGQLVVVDQVGEGPLRPAARRLVQLVRESADGNQNHHTLRCEEGQLVLPIQPSRRDSKKKQPEQRDVVQDVVARQPLVLAV